ncbi:MAG: nucleotidyl transferase AbiEii/AbiGii toxin family protein [Pirellulales bacterium]
MASKAAQSVLNQVSKALAPLDIAYSLIGGLALAVWSHPRSTRDVDLLVGVDHATAQPIIDALNAIGCRPKRVPPLNRVGEHSFLHFLYTPPGEFYDVQFDLLLAETEHEKIALANSVARKVPGIDVPIRVINCADLILLKLVSARIIDRADAAMLLRENRDAIDFEYLSGWATKLGVDGELAEIWREAFPGYELPNA